VRCKGKNAQQLVREKLTWNLTIAPLDAYCRQPFRSARWSDRPILQKPEPALLATRLIKQVKKILPPTTRRKLKRLLTRMSRFKQS
jgi:hypothetical protein